MARWLEFGNGRKPLLGYLELRRLEFRNSWKQQLKARKERTILISGLRSIEMFKVRSKTRQRRRRREETAGCN
jgi:hypothetical protein